MQILDSSVLVERPRIGDDLVDFQSGSICVRSSMSYRKFSGRGRIVVEMRATAMEKS
jgi:hypothetical protein